MKKSTCNSKIRVFKAESLENSIRFYITDRTYIETVEQKDCYITRFNKEKETDRNNLSIIKLLNKIIPLYIILMVLELALICYLITSTTNAFIYLFINIFSITDLFFIIILQSKECSPRLKSKHSCEHLMVNFIEANQRLPKNLEELKSSSRFHKNCGNTILVSDVATSIVCNTITAMFLIIVTKILKCNSNSVIFFSFLVLDVIIRHKKQKFNNCIGSIKRLLSFIVQCFSTTNRVTYKDLVLAYIVASNWLKIMYPDFYNKDDDIFLEQVFDIDMMIKL